MKGIGGTDKWKQKKTKKETMRIDIERNTDSEKRLMGYITAIAESRDQ